MSDDAGWIEAERDHEFRMEQEKTRQVRDRADARVEIAQTIGIVIGIISVLTLLVVAIWSGVDRGAKRDNEQVIACTEQGGTVFNTETGKVCLHLGDSNG